MNSLERLILMQHRLQMIITQIAIAIDFNNSGLDQGKLLANVHDLILEGTLNWYEGLCYWMYSKDVTEAFFEVIKTDLISYIKPHVSKILKSDTYIWLNKYIKEYYEDLHEY